MALLRDQGIRRFYVGGALEVDLWAGEILLCLKEQPEYSDIKLVVALPFEGHDAGWDTRSKSRLKFLINHSAEVVTVGTTAKPAAICYKRRNYYMADHADCLLAVYDNDRSVRSGTGMTVNYARQKGLPILLSIRIHQRQYNYKNMQPYHNSRTAKTVQIKSKINNKYETVPTKQITSPLHHKV